MPDIALALRIQTEYLKYGLQPPPLSQARYPLEDVVGQFDHACKRKFRKVFRRAYQARVVEIKLALTRTGWRALGNKSTAARAWREKSVDRQLLELDMRLAVTGVPKGSEEWQTRLAHRRRFVHRYLVKCAEVQEKGV